MVQTNPIKWKRGEFLTFYATMKIRVGGVGGTNGNGSVDILEGDEFEYDGSIVKYAGAEFPQSGLRGAIRQGWATMEEGDQTPEAYHADRAIAKSQTINRDLNNVQRTKAAPVELDHLDEETVLQVDDRRAARDKVSGRGHLGQEHNRRQASTAGRLVLEVSQSDYDQQDHTPIAFVKSKANIGKIDVLDPKNSNMARQLSMQSHEDGFGAYAGQKRRPNIVEREGVLIKTNVGTMDRGEVYMGDESEGEVVAQVRHSNAKNRVQDGVSIKDTSGRPGKKGSRAPVKKAAAAAKVSPPANKNASPANKTSSVAANPKLQVARKIYSDFPEDWNFYGKVDEKMAALKQHGASPDMLDALHASESSSMKKLLEKKFSSHFA